MTVKQTTQFKLLTMRWKQILKYLNNGSDDDNTDNDDDANNEDDDDDKDVDDNGYYADVANNTGYEAGKRSIACSTLFTKCC